MAKMFYTMEETKAALGKNEEEVKQLAREGRLREFRDGPRLMFKADQVEQLKAELGGGDDLSLAPAGESGGPLGLVDSKGGTGSVLGLADSAGVRKDDTAFADIGLSGSVGGTPSPKDSSAGTRTGSGVGSGGTRSGISVLDPDQATADPSAQTAINQGASDQLNLEGVGSGSGLLDLTRESDDTSLGAVFDELTPTAPGKRPAATTPAAAMETQAGEDLGIPAAGERLVGAPIYVSGADPFASALCWAAIPATAVVAFGGFVLIAATMGYRPSIMDALRFEAQFLIYFGAAVGLTVICLIVGLVLGKK